jgi:hypothetical protein
MAESTGELSMFTYETADQKEVRRFRIAQFNGRAATVRNGNAIVTGYVLASRSLRSRDSLKGKLAQLAWKGRDAVSSGAANFMKLINAA